jgi:UDP-MurNAc hydroxylase
VKLTCLGHAGLLVETNQGSVMCDPWFGPAFYGSWFPFPDNSEVRETITRSPDFLYVSHSHADHFDREFCKELDKNAVVILPNYPLDELEQELRMLGFVNFLHTVDGVPASYGGPTFTVFSNSSPSDGPMGDSALVIDDGEVRIFNQNDSRPMDLDAVKAAGPYDVHLLQHSGAVWFPMVYSMPPERKAAQGRRKRQNQLDRFKHYVDVVDATFVIPNSGPPCFLDPELFHHNDFGDDPANIFPDQRLAMANLPITPTYRHSGQLLLPGSVAHVHPGSFSKEHPVDPLSIFRDKRRYLEEYQERARPNIGTLDEGRFDIDLRAELMDWLTPLVMQTDLIAKGIGGKVVIDWGEHELVLDFEHRTVGTWDCEGDYVIRFVIDKAILTHLADRRTPNWVDDFFPSMRFKAHRRGPYNDYVNSFFRCLSPERIKYAEAWFATNPNDGFWTCGGYRIQRRCPHAQSDLARMGRVEGNVLTCTAHGLRFDLDTGECLDADDLSIMCEPWTAQTASAR